MPTTWVPIFDQNTLHTPVEGLAVNRAVIHAGPHKTGSTFIQATLALNAPALSREGWAWPHKYGSATEYASPKGLCGLARTLLPIATINASFAPGKSGRIQFCLTTTALTTPLRRWWHSEFLRIRNSLSGLVMSAEILDTVPFSGWMQLRGMIPHRDITAVFVYRNTIDKIRSSWAAYVDGCQRHQTADIIPPGCPANRAVVIFASFASRSTRLWRLSHGLRSIVPSALAGFELDIIDLEGIKASSNQSGIDIFDVLACDIMGLQCTRGRSLLQRPPGMTNSHRAVYAGSDATLPADVAAHIEAAFRRDVCALLGQLPLSHPTRWHHMPPGSFVRTMCGRNTSMVLNTSQ